MFHVMLAEATEEMLSDASQVGGSGALEPLAPFVGEPGVGTAPIVWAGVPLDEAAGREAVDETGQPTAAEQQPIRERSHPQRLLRRLGEVEKNLVGTERQAVLSLELGVERRDHAAVCDEHPAPRRELALVKLMAIGDLSHEPSLATVVARATTLRSARTNDIVARAITFPGGDE